MKHHTKDKGDIGVLKAQADLATQGFMVLKPLTEHAEFDLVIYKDSSFKTVQVKYRSMNKNGCMPVFFRSSWSDKYGVHTKHIDKSKIDLYCLYCPETDQCYYFDPKRFRKSLNLRVKASRNNQSKKVHLASDFLEVP
ncbi:MAG: group I intron-associated PD-(D/E)XK endonuclease [Elusimicrobiota bacterium]